MDALTERTCPHCQGTGSYTDPGDCPRCNGTGVLAKMPVMNWDYPPHIGKMMTEQIPGWEGSIGPGPRQYGRPHVYARDVQSGAGNCVCGRALGSSIHVQAAPGVPIPDHMRS